MSMLSAQKMFLMKSACSQHPKFAARRLGAIGAVIALPLVFGVGQES